MYSRLKKHLPMSINNVDLTLIVVDQTYYIHMGHKQEMKLLDKIPCSNGVWTLAFSVIVSSLIL